SKLDFSTTPAYRALPVGSCSCRACPSDRGSVSTCSRNRSTHRAYGLSAFVYRTSARSTSTVSGWNPTSRQSCSAAAASSLLPGQQRQPPLRREHAQVDHPAHPVPCSAAGRDQRPAVRRRRTPRLHVRPRPIRWHVVDHPQVPPPPPERGTHRFR